MLAFVPFPVAIGLYYYPGFGFDCQSYIAIWWSSSIADAATYLPSFEKATCIIPFFKVPYILAIHSIVSLSQINNQGFGPISPVAQYLPVGSTARQWISFICSKKNF